MRYVIGAIVGQSMGACWILNIWMTTGPPGPRDWKWLYLLMLESILAGMIAAYLVDMVFPKKK
jgi:hypothetical protein